MASKPQQDPELSSRLKKTNDELKQLQDSVKTGMINVKVLMGFPRCLRARPPGQRCRAAMAREPGERQRALSADE